MKKALVHDWYVSYSGGERCVESFTNIWDDLDYFSLVDILNDSDRKTILNGKKTKNSFIQRLPFGKTKHRYFFPLYPLAIEQFDLGEYDLILSSSSAVAKGVLTKHDQLHIAYVHSPIRYAWDLYFQYLEESGLKKGLKGIIARFFLHKIRMWDYSTSNRPDYYIANSKYIAKRIKKVYGKDSLVIYPPVDVSSFELSETISDYYVTCSRMVPYKKIDMIVEAFSNTTKKLVVIGDGPDFNKIKTLASQNVVFKGYVDAHEKKELIKHARAFVFAAEEDFGIAPVEAQACGVPVIAFAKGGALETIKGVFVDEWIANATGIFFKNQSSDSLIESVEYFEKVEKKFNRAAIRQHAQNFGKERFEKEFKDTVSKIYEEWKERGTS